MRTLVAAVLAVPVIAAAYVPRSLRRSAALRVLMLASLSLVVAVAIAPGFLGSRTSGPTSDPTVTVLPGPVGDLGSAPAADPLGPTEEVSAVAAVDGIAMALPALRIVQAAYAADASIAPGPAPTGTVATPAAPVVPAVVRFRPLPGTTAVLRTAPVSVRFTVAMAHAATQKAFSVHVNGIAVSGSYAWYEGSTVLVMTPTHRFPAGAKVTLAVSRSARSVAGVALAKAASSTFRVESATAATATTTKIVPVGTGLHSVELYYLSLMNCTRTGGWVSSSGACTGAGTRNVKPLVLDAGISDKVSRPYAYFMASRNICTHFADGNPGTRLSRAGYRNWDWAENIGCLSTSPYRSMLLTHLFYQSEKPYDGGHYRNLMNPLYDRVGIGVVVVHGVLRLVIDFYRP